MPHMAKLDQVLSANLQEAVLQLGVKVEVHQTSLSAILNGGGGLTAKQNERVLALFEKHGARCAPIVLIEDQVKFAGKPPTTEQLKEALQSAVPPQK